MNLAATDSWIVQSSDRQTGRQIERQLCHIVWMVCVDVFLTCSYSDTCRAASPSPINLSLLNLASINLVSLESGPGKNTWKILTGTFLPSKPVKLMMMMMVTMMVMMKKNTFPSLPSFWLVASICQSTKLKLDNRTSPDGRLGGKSYCKLTLRLKRLWSGLRFYCKWSLRFKEWSPGWKTIKKCCPW